MFKTLLPVVNHDLSLDDAWKTVRKKRQPGLVAGRGKRLRLYTAVEISKAKDKGKATRLKDLSGAAIHVGSQVYQKNVASPQPSSVKALAAALKKSDKKYGILWLPGDETQTALVYGDRRFSFAEPRPKDKGKKRPPPTRGK